VNVITEVDHLCAADVPALFTSSTGRPDEDNLGGEQELPSLARTSVLGARGLCCTADWIRCEEAVACEWWSCQLSVISFQ